MEESFNKIILRKHDLHYAILILVVFFSFFDPHIEKILGIKRFPLPEIILVFLALGVLLINSFNSLKTNVLNLGILTVILLTVAIGAWNKINVITILIGTIWLYKAFIAFYLGNALNLSQKRIREVLKFLFRVAIISMIFTWIQFFIMDLNPFGFKLDSSGILGIMDNPNKNGFILLFGLFYVSVFNYKKRVLFIIFIISIFFTQSRQIIILLLFFIFYIFVIIKRNYKIFLFIFFSGLILTILFRDVLFYRFTELPRILDTGNYFRLKALKIGFEVLKDTYFFGSGPGTFGGFVASLTDSEIHSKYNLFQHWSTYRDSSKIPSTIDMYWPHLLVEVGVFVFILVSLIYRKMYLILKENAKTNQNSLILMMFFIVLIFMSIFSMTLEASYSAIAFFLLIGANLKYKNEESSFQ